jgi:two-component system, cell cycle sensor histidine kinase and response regulator CckA
MVCLQSLAPSLKRRFLKLFGPRVEVIWLRAAELDRVAGDLIWIEDVLFDMAVRARTAIPFGGRLVIEWANIELDLAMAEGQGLAAGRYVMLEMTCLRHDPSECGASADVLPPVPGFPDEWLHCDFSQAKGMIRSLGGQICEYNEPGRALTIRAFFPSESRSDDNQDMEVSKELRQFRILLVEDENYVRDVACEILESEGYQVLTARTGQEALEMFEQSRPVQLLLTDVVMPGMTGHDLAEQLMLLDPGLKTIYMSGYMEGLGARMHRHDANLPFIQKPFTLESLTAMVKQVLNPAPAPAS